MKRLTSVIFIIFLVSLFNLGFAADKKNTKASTKKYFPKGTPTRAIQGVDDMLDDYKTGELTEADREHNRKLKKGILNGTFDIKELSKLALDKHWNEISGKQQIEFVELLTSLLEEKAVFSKEQIKGGDTYHVSYLGDTFFKDNTRALTKTAVAIKTENISIGLNYKLKKEGDDWKVYDVIVDEASLLDNYRFQFDSIILKHGYNELVHKMKTKLIQIQKNKKEAEEQKQLETQQLPGQQLQSPTTSKSSK
ncbi:ABC transporter substrate-binding protein [bacterium]|nr:ABC transporter substrate-binding protein [bacterium]